MGENEGVRFHEKVTADRGVGRAARVGVVAGVALLVVVGAVATMGASPSPSTVPGASTAPDASSAPDTQAPEQRAGRGFGFGFGLGGDGIGRHVGARSITIIAIDGDQVSLRTDDGWTRTITVTSSTTIQRGGETITVGDLEVGDAVRFAQERADDGTYTVTRLVVVLPTIGGEVTAVNGSTITVQRFDGTTGTIHVSGDTTYTVRGVDDASLANVTVGSIVVAEGTERADGSLDAARVASGIGRFHRDGERGWPKADPSASPAPSSQAG